MVVINAPKPLKKQRGGVNELYIYNANSLDENRANFANVERVRISIPNNIPNNILLLTTIARQLPEMPNLTELYVEGNYPIGNRGAEIIANAIIAFGRNTTTVRYRGNMSDSSAIIDAFVTSGHADLRTKNMSQLSRRYLTSKMVERAASNIGFSNKLTVLKLASNNIGPIGVSFIAIAMPYMAMLTNLDMSNNNIGYVGAVVLAVELPSIRKLKSLNLAQNILGDNGASEIATALSQLTALNRLVLYNNQIDDTGMKALAKALPTGLTYIDLSLNWIGDEGAEALAHVLPSMKSLNHLDLSRNIKIGNTGSISFSSAKKIIEAFYTGSMKHLYIGRLSKNLDFSDKEKRDLITLSIAKNITTHF